MTKLGILIMLITYGKCVLYVSDLARLNGYKVVYSVIQRQRQCKQSAIANYCKNSVESSKCKLKQAGTKEENPQSTFNTDDIPSNKRNTKLTSLRKKGLKGTFCPALQKNYKDDQVGHESRITHFQYVNNIAWKYRTYKNSAINVNIHLPIM